MERSASHQQIGGIDDIENQIPSTEEDINAQIRPLGGAIRELKEKYANKTTVWNLLLSTCTAGYAGILAAVLSGQKMKDVFGCASATATVILSGIVSTSFILAFVYAFVLQFGILKRIKQIDEERDTIVDDFLPNATLIGKRTLFPSYGQKALQATYLTWCLPRAVFLVVLTAISVCLLVSCGRLLC